MGMCYNIPPIRTKKKVYLDVISESINNPIRLVLGWFIITSAIYPPSSLLFAYSTAQTHEKLFKELKFMMYVLFLIALVFFLLVYDIPQLNWFLENSFLESGAIEQS